MRTHTCELDTSQEKIAIYKREEEKKKREGLTHKEVLRDKTLKIHLSIFQEHFRTVVRTAK